LAAQGLSLLIECLGHSMREVYGVGTLLLFLRLGLEQREQIPPDLRLQVLCILAQAEPPQGLAQGVGISGRRQGGSHFAPAEDDLDRSQAGELHRLPSQLDGGVAKDDRIAQQLVEVEHDPPVSTHRATIGHPEQILAGPHLELDRRHLGQRSPIPIQQLHLEVHGTGGDRLLVDSLQDLGRDDPADRGQHESGDK
jgi:hypothetical protein